MPAYSPDGSKIIFVSDRYGQVDLYEMPSSGGTPRRLTQDAESETWPAYSPNGAWIVFGWLYPLPPPPLGIGGFASHLIKISSDGTQRFQLTNHDSLNWLGQFSPDSQDIAFASTRDGQQEIYLISQDGTNLKRLTQNPAEDSAPTWADQDRILFTSTRDYPQETSLAELYSIRRDGTEEQRLSSGLQVSSPPSLSPQSTLQPGPLELTYAYDALSRLISVTEKNQAGEVRTYTFGYRGPADQISYIEGPGGEVIHKNTSGASLQAYAQKDNQGTWRVFLQAHDQRGDTSAMVLPDGRIAKRQTYSDYGSQSSLPSIPYGFLGSYKRLHLPQTGLDLLGARFYHPGLGRFLTKDPIPGGSANAYEYAAGDPINRADPSGTFFRELGLFFLHYNEIVCAIRAYFGGPGCAPGAPAPPPLDFSPRARTISSLRGASRPAVGDPSGYREERWGWGKLGKGLLTLGVLSAGAAVVGRLRGKDVDLGESVEAGWQTIRAVCLNPLAGAAGGTGVAYGFLRAGAAAAGEAAAVLAGTCVAFGGARTAADAWGQALA